MNDGPHAMHENASIARDQGVATMFSASASPSAPIPSVGNALRGVPNGTLSSRSRSASERIPYKCDTRPRIAGRGRWWLAACLLIAALFAGKAMFPPSAPRVSPPKVSTVSSVTAKQPASQPIETIHVGQRVISQTVGAFGETQVDPRTWRLLRLRAEYRWPDGTDDPVEIETLQPRDWIERNGARVGADVPMPFALVEIGLPADMRGKVIANEPCPPIESGQGRVVLATTTQLNAHVVELTVADEHGQQEPVRATANHPFYSADRSQWVAAGELREGEHLQGIQGRLTLLRSERLPGIHRVYNMTVEEDHVYRVSLLGALVHNTSARTSVPVGGGTAAGGVAKPSVIDPKLSNLVEDLYKGTKTPNPLGTGSTADAIRNELQTGQATFGKFHSDKGQQYVNALTKWLAQNPNASPGDISAAQQMLNDLQSALGGK
jgi:hypothetical protein